MTKRYTNTYADGWWDKDLWGLRQTGGGTHPVTGAWEGLSWARLSERTGLSVSVLRRRIGAYQRGY